MMTKLIIIVAIFLIVIAFIAGYMIGYAKGTVNLKEILKSTGQTIIDRTIGGGLR